MAYEIFIAETSRYVCQCGKRHSQFETSFNTYYYCPQSDELCSIFSDSVEKLDRLINNLRAALLWFDSPPKTGTKDLDRLKYEIGESLSYWDK